MAIMVPDSLPGRNVDGERISAGERRVFALLQKLPDDWLVYYEPVVRHRHPDFIVILPAVGVLVIEIKGWWHAELNTASPTAITLTRRGQEIQEKHPGEQARDYMRLAMDKCRDHPLAGRLMQSVGSYQNRLVFPFAYMSVLSNINRSQLEKGPRELAEIFPEAKTATKDQLAKWDALGPEELAARLKTYFDPWWPFPKLTRQQVDIIRSVIHPEIVLRQSEMDLKALDFRQERNARAIGNGHRVIYGVAGSGKTVLLIARAKLLAADPKKRILLLCHNKLLASYLATAAQSHKNITALHLHRWGARNGAEFRPGEDDAVYGERLQVCLQGGARDRGQFDAVLIDECQDWPCSWFHCAKFALKDPEAGDMLIVGDGSQSLYRKRTFTWTDAGVNARGRTINTRFDLDRNYRNTVEILRAALPFAARPHGRTVESASVLALPVDPDKAIRNGPEPAIVELRNALDESHYAAALIETWLRGGVKIRGRREPVAARDIAVLYPRIREDAMNLLCERLDVFTRAVWLSARAKAPGNLQDEGVRIMTIRGSRGLQFRIVLLLWADQLPYKEQMDERSDLYVAMTRAEDVLVILHSGRSVYIDELRANGS